MVAEDDRHRQAHTLFARERGAEHRRFRNREPDVKADQHESGAEEKRQPPAEGEELVVGQALGQKEKHAAGKEKTDRRAELREHPVPRASMRWCVFDGEEDRASPFAAETQSLSEPAERQQRWR